MIGGEEVSEIWGGQMVESFIGEDQESSHLTLAWELVTCFGPVALKKALEEEVGFLGLDTFKIPPPKKKVKSGRILRIG